MKLKQKAINLPLEILYNNHFVDIPCMVSSTGITPDSEGKKIVKAGTILPQNDATAKGVLLTDVDVTNGDCSGTIIIHGFIDNAKLVKNGITVSAEAVSALKMIDFIGYTSTNE